MTNKNFKLYIIFPFALVLLFQTAAFSQTATLSPYSRYGIGDLLFNGFSHQRAMGGLSVGIQQSAYLNFGNPASYAADSIVMFQLGLNLEAMKFANNDVSVSKTNGNIAYISMGFPLIKNHWYLNVGMIPMSAVGYKNILMTDVNYPGNANFLYEGSGGYNRYYGGMGFRLSKKLTIGFNASYLYGTSTHTSKVEFSESGFYNTQIQNTTTLSDIYLTGGLQYSTTTKKGLQVTFGLSGEPSQNINAKRDLVWLNYTSNGSFPVPKDTVLFEDGEKGDVKLPLNAGFGFSVSRKNHWLVGAEVKMQKWEDFTYYGINDSLNNSYRVSIGGQWIPDDNSTRYYNKVIYRAGAYYSSGYLELNNEAINDIGVTFGLGIPLRGKPYFSHLDLAFEFGREGTTNNNLIRERYARLVIGLTFREDWFRRTKFD